MKDDALETLAGCGIVSVGCLGIAIFSTIVGILAIYFGWNLALGPILDKGPITLFQATLIMLVLSVVGGFFRSTTRVSK